MQRVRQKDTSAETTLRRELHALGLRYRIQVPILTKPRRVADVERVFVDQKCLVCGHVPCPCCGAWCDVIGPATEKVYNGVVYEVVDLTAPEPLIQWPDEPYVLNDICCDGNCTYAAPPNFTFADGAPWPREEGDEADHSTGEIEYDEDKEKESNMPEAKTEGQKTKELLELIARKSKELEGSAKNVELKSLALCANLLTAIVDKQEDRLQKLEEAAAQPFAMGAGGR